MVGVVTNSILKILTFPNSSIHPNSISSQSAKDKSITFPLNAGRGDRELEFL
jgi:hypothetical protein